MFLEFMTDYFQKHFFYTEVHDILNLAHSLIHVYEMFSYIITHPVDIELILVITDNRTNV